MFAESVSNFRKCASKWIDISDRVVYAVKKCTQYNNKEKTKTFDSQLTKFADTIFICARVYCWWIFVCRIEGVTKIDLNIRNLCTKLRLRIRYSYKSNINRQETFIRNSSTGFDGTEINLGIYNTPPSYMTKSLTRIEPKFRKSENNNLRKYPFKRLTRRLTKLSLHTCWLYMFKLYN